MTIDNARRTELIADTNAALDELGTITAEDLVRPFALWLRRLHEIYEATGDLDFLAEVDKQLHDRAVVLVDELARAGELISAIAFSHVPTDFSGTADGARSIFEAVTRLPQLRAVLLDDATLWGELVDTS